MQSYMSQPEIFVSYAWKGERETLVDQLCAAFAAKGYTITRDKSDLTYKGRHQSFYGSHWTQKVYHCGGRR
jgi:hypothetical protein